jgi:hypothetical protein
MKIRSHSGFSHHLLLPLLAILAVGSIGAYLTFASNAATPTAPAKRGLVDDGPYASKPTETAPSVTHDYKAGSPYNFAVEKVGMRHVVLNVGLKELISVNSTSGGTSYISNSLETRLKKVSAWNATHPNKLTVHLRFHAGTRAPAAWRTICGSMTISDPQLDGSTATVPKWWVYKNSEYPYQRLYKNAMTVLAEAVRKINSTPSTANLIGSVNIPGAAMNYPEPMVLYAYSASNLTAYQQAGFNKDEHNKFMMWLPSTALIFTQRTNVNVELAINPYQNINTSVSPWAVDKSTNTKNKYIPVATKLIGLVGNRAVISNYSVREEYMTGTGDYQSMYAWMRGLATYNKAWVGVQLARPPKLPISDEYSRQVWDKVAKWADNEGFNFVETSGPKMSDSGPNFANQWPESYSSPAANVELMASIQKQLEAN